ncbi:Protein of unknown function (DUF2283) [Opitutaceae bacterium TAV1]|nr:Protein of unknown function (DUF2283) [Opitutaceae bacterium TAV1]
MASTRHPLAVSRKHAPVVEFDRETGGVYVRFKRASVARTIDRSTSALTLTVDLDACGDVIGIEAFR